MLHPHTKLSFIDDQIGYGVFAAELIPAGTITWALDPLDHRVPASKHAGLSAALLRVLEHYAFLDAAGDYILCWDFARFLNHSCDANALAPGLDIEIAVRDIQPGEQLTGDYGAYNLEEDLTCRCGAASCRGIVRNSDFERLADQWDDALRRAARRVRDVHQPLWAHVSDRAVLQAAAEDPQLLPTCRIHRIAQVPERLSAHG